MYDRVDEWVVSLLTEFEGKPLQSVAKGGLDLSKLGERGRQEGAGAAGRRAQGDSSSAFRRSLKDRASAVRVTSRLTDSPACLVSDEHGMSTHLERMLKAAGQNVPTSKPILEINPQHPIVQRLKDESDEPAVRRLEPHPVRPGDAGRRRSARRPGGVRQAVE